MIKIKGLSKSFGDNRVLSDIDLDIGRRGVVSILGPNGSGKTTLIKCVLGLVRPDVGSIWYEDKNILGTYEYRSDFSHLPQLAEFPDNLSIQELILFMKGLRAGITTEVELVDAFNLQNDLNKRIRHLSGGTKQKVNLLITLMYNPKVLILDEPTSGLDPLSIINLKNIIRKRVANDVLVIITTHIMSFAEDLAEHIIFLLEGRVYYNGPMDDLIMGQSASNLENAIANILVSNKGQLIPS